MLAGFVVGCATEGRVPLELPEGSVVAADLTLRAQPEDGWPAVIALFGSSEVEPVVWDRCVSVALHDGVGVAGSTFGLPSEAWAFVDGRRIDLPSRGLWMSDEDVPDPYGVDFGGGWFESQLMPGAAIDVAMATPAPLRLRRPDLDADRAVSRSHDLEVRWSGSTEGAVHLSLRDADRIVSCTAIDDGRLDVPADQIATLHGDVTITARRTVRAYEELSDGTFASFTFEDQVSGPLALDGPHR